VLRLASAEQITPEARMFLTVGVCGGFTTFSAFSAETFELMQSGQWTRAAIYVTASILLCVLATAGGWLGGGLFAPSRAA
jgi:CrcB protein